MKKITSALTGIAILALINFSHANGQDVASSINKFSNPDNQLSSEVANKTSALSATAAVSKRAIKDFTQTYKGKIQPVWNIIESGGFIASFTDADMQNCVYYDKRGNWVSSIKRYDESKMSPELRQIIKPVYYDYKINCIAEIAVPGNVVHLVYLAENASSFKTVRVCNGEMEVIEWIKDNKMMDL